MKLVPLVLVAAVSLTSCYMEDGRSGRSLRMPEVGEWFDVIYVHSPISGPAIHDAVVLRVEGRSVLVRRGPDSETWTDIWIDWEDVALTEASRG